MNTLWQDLRYAFRQLRRSPGFATAAVLTLALGIGATTAIFSLIYQVILRSIPVSHPEQLYKVGNASNCCITGGLQGDWSMFSYDLYRYLGDQTKGTAGIAAVQAGTITVSARPAAHVALGDSATSIPLDVSPVSGNYFAVLGVRPFLGRVLNEEDDHEGAAPVAVMSYTLWKTKFNGDPRLLGETLLLSGHAVTVVGISAPKFLGERNTESPAGLWLTLSQEPMLEPDRNWMKLPGSHYLDLLVRIEDAQKVSGIQVAIQGELRQWLAANPQSTQNGSPKDIARQTTELAPASGGINDLRNEYQSSLRLLFLVAGFVLLLACANLANLMLVRSMARQQQLAVRSALGAPRMRLVRQMLVETLLLSTLGGLAALAVAYGASRAILALAMPGAEMNSLSATPSLPVLGFALLTSLITGLTFGSAPAWITSQANPVEALRGANRSTRDASALPQKLMVIFQVAISLALLSTAGLLITSLRHQEHQDFQFDTGGRLLVSIDLQAAGYTYPQLAGLYQQFDDLLGHLPGIYSFAYGSYSPMTGSRWASGVAFPGRTPEENDVADYDSVSTRYFETVGTRVMLGRGFSDQDTATSRHVALVNQAFVRHYLKGKQPVGEHFGPEADMDSAYEVVGVVADTKYGSPLTPASPMFFMPITQATSYVSQQDKSQEKTMHFASTVTFHYRGEQSAVTASIRQAFQSINPEIPIFSIRPYQDQLSSNFTQDELVVRLTTLFGILALLLASIGMYGTTAYSVMRRTSELGIRMALGASRAQVLGIVVRGALGQALIGLGIGLPLAMVAGKTLQHTLYQTSAFQPLVLTATAALLMTAAMIAAFLPAHRATTIDPMQALRME